MHRRIDDDDGKNAGMIGLNSDNLINPVHPDFNSYMNAIHYIQITE